MDWFKEYFEDFISLFYPNVCQACGQAMHKGEEVICTYCQYFLPKTNFHLGRDNAIEKHFWGRVNLNRAAAMYFFQKGSRVQHLVHQLKYKGQTEIGVKLGKLYGLDLNQSSDYSSVDVIIPVPLHRSKEMQRSYNQVHAFPFSILENSVKNPSFDYPEHPKSIGEHLKKRRLDLRLSQESVAKIIKTTNCIISNWELGYTIPRIKFLPRIISLLGYNPFTNTNHSLPEKLRSYRKIHGLSQGGFAKLIGVHQSSITNWERGLKPQQKFKKKLEALLTT